MFSGFYVGALRSPYSMIVIHNPMFILNEALLPSTVVVCQTKVLGATTTKLVKQSIHKRNELFCGTSREILYAALMAFTVPTYVLS